MMTCETLRSDMNTMFSAVVKQLNRKSLYALSIVQLSWV
jgi:hypothetical protein